MTDAEPAHRSAPLKAVPLARGLSTKLLVLTVLFVMIAEVLIFLPSVANFRLQWLGEKLNTAAAVSSALLEQGDQHLSDAARNDVLMAIGARAIAVRDAGISRLMVVSDMPPHVDEQIDLRRVGQSEAIMQAVDTLLFGGDRMLRVYGKVGSSPKEFELIIPDRSLRSAMLVYARDIALLSLLVSLFTAGLVFFTIDRIMIRPIRGMTRSMLAFAAAPEEENRIIVPAARSDEIGLAEHQLAAMQTELRRTLSERRHLADLGLAVSKINHDMRNVLASAQLISDRLRLVKEPSVQAFVPKLVRSLDRAVAYTEGVMAYGRAQEPPPSRRRLRLRQLVDEVHGLLGIDTGSGIEFDNQVDASFEIDADAEQLFRVLTNLCRNAVQAMAADDDGSVVKRLAVSAERQDAVSRILVSDTGPGLPQKARENLFAAFRGAARSGGTGLGLAIAQELARAHGGFVELIESRGGRTVFAVTIPDQPAENEQTRALARRPAWN